jgi:hypothetical protein
VFTPNLLTRVVEPHDFACYRINAGEIGALEEIAEGAMVIPLKLTSIDLIRRFR